MEFVLCVVMFGGDWGSGGLCYFDVVYFGGGVFLKIF